MSEYCHCRVGMLLDQAQGCSQDRNMLDRVFHCFRAWAQALQQELVSHCQPDVHGPHGGVGEGADCELLRDIVVDVQQVNILTSSKSTSSSQVHIWTLVTEPSRYNLTSLQIDPSDVGQN